MAFPLLKLCGTRPILGDALFIGGTFFFAMSNVGEEFCVKKKDRVEVIAMIGLFGMLVSVCEIALLERKNLESAKWSAEVASEKIYLMLILLFFDELTKCLRFKFGLFSDIGLCWLCYSKLSILLDRTFSSESLLMFESAHWLRIQIVIFGCFCNNSFLISSLIWIQLSGATLFNLSILTSSDMWAVVIRIFFYKQKVDWLYYLAFALVVVGLIIYSRTEKDVEEGDHLEQERRLLEEENMVSRNETEHLP